MLVSSGSPSFATFSPYRLARCRGASGRSSVLECAGTTFQRTSGRRRTGRILTQQVHDPKREGQVEDGLRVPEIGTEELLDAVDPVDDRVDVDEATRGDATLHTVLVEVGAEGRDELSTVRPIVVEERSQRSGGERRKLLSSGVPEQEAVGSELPGTDDRSAAVQLEHQVDGFAGKAVGRGVLVRPAAAAADPGGEPVRAEDRLEMGPDVVDERPRLRRRPAAHDREHDRRSEMLDGEAARRPHRQSFADQAEDTADPIVVELGPG